MSKKKKVKTAPRNPYALDAKSRRAGMAPMKDRRTPRGGSKNKQLEFLKQYIEDKEK